MPDKNVHKDRGTQAAIGVYLDVCLERGQRPDLMTLAAVGWLGGLAGTVPDRLDGPERGPSHRGWAHSLEFYALVRNQYVAARRAGRSVEAAVLRSVMTHHEDDAQTRAGIPSLVELCIRWLFN